MLMSIDLSSLWVDAAHHDLSERPFGRMSSRIVEHEALRVA